MNEKTIDMLMDVAKMVTQESGDVRGEILALCMKVLEVDRKLSDSIIDNYDYKNYALFKEVLNLMSEYIEHINFAINKIKGE